MLIELEKEDVCRLLMACTITEKISSPALKSTWKELHDKVQLQLQHEGEENYERTDCLRRITGSMQSVPG